MQPEGRSAARQYAHVKSLARDADLDSLKPEMIMIIITLNSLDHKDSRLREKMLEAVGQGKEKMTDTVFLRLIGEHEAWLANNGDKGTFKAEKAGVHRTRSQHVGAAGRRAITRTGALRKKKHSAKNVEIRVTTRKHAKASPGTIPLEKERT